MGKNPSWFAFTGNGKDKVAGQSTSEHPVETCSRSPVLCIPDQGCSITRHETQGTEVLPELSTPAGEVGRPRGAVEGT